MGLETGGQRAPRCGAGRRQDLGDHQKGSGFHLSAVRAIRQLKEKLFGKYVSPVTGVISAPWSVEMDFEVQMSAVTR